MCSTGNYLVARYDSEIKGEGGFHGKICLRDIMYRNDPFKIHKARTSVMMLP